MEDRFGHRISYLRVSVTDRCNERCPYCMPQELQEWLPRAEILSYEETLRIIRISAHLGVTKIRITGGEPLTRRAYWISSAHSQDSGDPRYGSFDKRNIACAGNFPQPDDCSAVA